MQRSTLQTDTTLLYEHDLKTPSNREADFTTEVQLPTLGSNLLWGLGGAQRSGSRRGNGAEITGRLMVATAIRDTRLLQGHCFQSETFHCLPQKRNPTMQHRDINAEHSASLTQRYCWHFINDGKKKRSASLTSLPWDTFSLFSKNQAD